jgi:hypothetical protein
MPTSFLRLVLATTIATIPLAPCAIATERVVGTSSELVAAVQQSSPGDTVRLQPGEYLLGQMVRVPDGVTLDGGGSVVATQDGVPDEVLVEGAATLRAADDLPGDFISLGDGSALRGLRIVQTPPTAGRTQYGNTVVVSSRRPADRLAASIRYCDIHSNATVGAGPAGPTGRAILVETRSPAGEASHEGASVTLSIEYTAIRAPLGNAIFANNFAARGETRIDIRRSLVEGFIVISGGTSREAPVTRASSRFESEETHYRRVNGGVDRIGWQLFGATGMPAPTLAGAVAGGQGNRNQVFSRRDRIDGFRIGVLASAYRRVADYSGPGADNRLELSMQDTVIHSVGDAAADLVLRGAGADPSPQRDVRLTPGQRNELQVRLTGVRGSGPRANRYVDCDCPATDPAVDDGNRVVLEGTAAEFALANPGVLPPPPATMFRRQQP